MGSNIGIERVIRSALAMPDQETDLHDRIGRNLLKKYIKIELDKVCRGDMHRPLKGLFTLPFRCRGSERQHTSHMATARAVALRH